METNIIRIGNSKGIVLPAALLSHYALEGKIELVAKPEGILIQPKRTLREGWTEKINAVIAKYGSEPVDEDWHNIQTEFDEEWQW